MRLVSAFSIPWSSLSVNAIHAGHTRCRDLSTECQYIACVRAELHMIAVDPALQFAMLIRSMEGSRDNVVVLAELNLFQRTSRATCVVGIDGPVARDVRRRRRWCIFAG